MSDAWASSWGTSWGSSWAAGVATVSTTALKILSLRLNQQLSMSISYTGDCIPLSLATGLPTAAPASGKGLVAYIDGANLKLAAWDGAAWVTT